jgi:hypothetical protein
VDIQGLGKILLVTAAMLAILGLVLLLAGRVGFLGKLPGDILIKRENFTLYFPLTTFVVLSLVLTILVNLIIRLLK